MSSRGCREPFDVICGTEMTSTLIGRIFGMIELRTHMSVHGIFFIPVFTASPPLQT
jgi:hypothetical protein